MTIAEQLIHDLNKAIPIIKVVFKGTGLAQSCKDELSGLTEDLAMARQVLMIQAQTKLQDETSW